MVPATATTITTTACTAHTTHIHSYLGYYFGYRASTIGAFILNHFRVRHYITNKCEVFEAQIHVNFEIIRSNNNNWYWFQIWCTFSRYSPRMKICRLRLRFISILSAAETFGNLIIVFVGRWLQLISSLMAWLAGELGKFVYVLL